MLPEAFALFQNYPNPFNPSTQISFDVPSAEFITLRVYNLLGQDVKTLSSKTMNPGRYIFEWDGTDLLNNDVASGVYFYELRGESFISRKKMLLIR
jgi:flagellar hook assembly protein FlgD